MWLRDTIGRRVLTLAVVGLAGAVASGAATQRFYLDDPITRDPETQDAAAVRPWEISDSYDLLQNSFLGAGEQTSRRALNINTLDEVPDSSWFINRIGARSMSEEEIARGPDQGTGPAPGRWTMISGKSEGVTPGLTMKDSTGQIYFIKFDPPSNPEMATGAEVISTKLFYALGYYVPENYLATMRREDLVIAEGATMTRPDGHKHRVQEKDVDALLQRVAKNADGTYRVVASKGLPGRPVGPFRYHGTRPDDPNDIFPHEHRRELRGMRVSVAWLNHDEWRSSNSFDTLIEMDGRTIVRHYLIDFGSTLGSASIEAQRRRPGNEYVWETRPTLITMLTLGFYIRPWIRVKFPEIPAVGRIEADFFHPELWKPEYPNPAFNNARPDDTFWGARRVAAFSDDAIRAVVKTARFSDPAAEQYLTDVLIKRRDKVCRLWLNGVNPLVDFTMNESGGVRFENAAVEAGVAEPASEYRLSWSRFENATGTSTPVGGETTVRETRAQAPAELLTSEFVMLEVRASSPQEPEWARPVHVYFRHTGSGWKTVGLERWRDEDGATRTK